MYRILRRLFRKLPFLHDTLEQDLHNPLQRDRLPDTRNIELEFPVVSGSLEQNRRLTRRYLWIALAVSFGLATIEIFTDQLFLSIPNLFAAAGFLVVWLSYLAVRQPPLTWFWLWIVTPHVVLALVFIDDPTLCWIVFGVLSVCVADLFATHYLHLQTTAPMDRPRALNLRQLWQCRFGLGRVVTGGEFYLLALLIPLAAGCAVVWAEQFVTAPYALRNLYRFAGLVLAILAAAFAVEVMAAFLFARPILSPRMMCRHLKTALTHWLTYNRTEIDAPGAYQTPAGACKYRKRMALGLVLLVSAAIPQFVSPRRDYELTEAGRHPTYDKDAPYDLLEEPTVVKQPQPDASKTRIADPQKSSGPPELEVYQQRMLERMPPDEQGAYLARLNEEHQARLAKQAEQSNVAEQELQKEASDPPAPHLKLSGDAFAKLLTSVYSALGLLLVPLLTAFVSLGWLFALVFANTGRLAARFGPTTTISPDEILSADRWDELVGRVQNSRDETEKSSLLLGVNAADNTPILVPRDVFTEHAHLLGDSGSGKTSIGIASILSQLIRCGECSVVVLDLKGDDLALFQGVLRDAQDAGLRFRWFTNQLEHSTYAFNPLRQRPLERMTLYQKVDMLTAAMGLQYGRDYGRAYYSDANARLLHAALEQHGRIESFQHLAAILGDANGVRGIDRELRQAGAHLGAIVNRLADSEALNVVPNNGHPQSVVDGAIEFTDVFRTPQAVHFHLTSTIGTTSSAEIARIALYSLITAASAVPPKDRVQTFVVIDEFQRIVAGNIEILLQLARSLNIGVILANQSLMDLKTAGVDLIPAISANTRFRQIFAASNLEEQERISRGSGEALTFQQSWHEYLAGGIGAPVIDGRNLSETITPRLRINDILLATDHPLQSIVQIRRGDGYAQYGGMPFVMRSTHHISVTEYRNRKEAGWPQQTEETLVPQIHDGPRVRGQRPGWFSSDEVLIDEPGPAESAGHYLDQLYQKQLAESDDEPASEEYNRPDHSAKEEKDNE